MREKLKMTRARYDYTGRHPAESQNYYLHCAIRTGNAAYVYGTHVILVCPWQDM